MKKWILPLGSLTTIVVALVVSLAVAGVFDSDGASSDETTEDVAGICLEGDEDCVDTVDGDGEAADCLPDAVDCGNDTPGEGDGIAQACLAGAEDCKDTPAPPPDVGDVDPDKPVSSDEPIVGEPSECAPDNLVACERRAVETAYAALEELGGPPANEMEVSTEFVEWPNACLGVEQPDVACAEVITPGFIIVLDNGLLAYEFHTDLNGNAVLATPAQ